MLRDAGFFLWVRCKDDILGFGVGTAGIFVRVLRKARFFIRVRCKEDLLGFGVGGAGNFCRVLRKADIFMRVPRSYLCPTSSATANPPYGVPISTKKRLDAKASSQTLLQEWKGTLSETMTICYFLWCSSSAPPPTLLKSLGVAKRRVYYYDYYYYC